MMDPVESTLFLHGGPGMCAIPERALYGDSLPIRWWDQPRSAVLLRAPFAALVDFAEEALLQSVDGPSQKLHVIAHSFGANVARHLALRLPERIASITLLAPTHDLADAFVRLARVVAAHAPDPTPLQKALRTFMLERQSFSCFLALVHEILSVPNFLDAYWSRDAIERRDWFTRLMLAEPVFDLDAFTAIARDHWIVPRLSAKSDFAGPVRIVFGDSDPLVDPGTSLPVWRNWFRNVTADVLHSGHMIQLECPANEWWHHAT